MVSILLVSVSLVSISLVSINTMSVSTLMSCEQACISRDTTHDKNYGATEVRTNRTDSTIMEQQRCAPCPFHDRGVTEVRTDRTNFTIMEQQTMEVHTVPFPRSCRFHDCGATDNGCAHRANSTIMEQQRCTPCRFHNRGTTTR